MTISINQQGTSHSKGPFLANLFLSDQSKCEKRRFPLARYQTFPIFHAVSLSIWVSASSFITEIPLTQTAISPGYLSCRLIWILIFLFQWWQGIQLHIHPGGQRHLPHFRAEHHGCGYRPGRRVSPWCLLGESALRFLIQVFLEMLTALCLRHSCTGLSVLVPVWLLHSPT